MSELVFLFSDIDGPKINGSAIAYAQTWCAAEGYVVGQLFTQRADVDAFTAMLQLIPGTTKHVVIPTPGHITKVQRRQLAAAGAVVHVAATTPTRPRMGPRRLPL